jgi:hypothetical protein
VDLSPADAVAVLERTPASLRALLDGLPDAWLLASEGPDTFSPRDVIGHLIHGEETDWVPADEDHPRARRGRALHALRSIRVSHGVRRPFHERAAPAFRGLARGEPARGGAMRLDAVVLARKGTHPGLGRVTFGQLLAAWVVHDLGHVKQVARTMAGQYRDAVGPWREYLTILDRP